MTYHQYVSMQGSIVNFFETAGVTDQSRLQKKEVSKIAVTLLNIYTILHCHAGFTLRI